MLFVRVAEGMLKTFAIEQSKNLDELSNSTGSCDGITRRCTNCDGTGMETSIHRNGPFIQQTRRECSVCHGSGEMVDPKNRCRKCYGKKVIREEKILDVNIVPGSADCETVKFHGEGHQIVSFYDDFL